jgi:hypothetical protein
MSLTAVRPFFRSVLNSQGYQEWVDAFNIENIPSTVLTKGAYHIESNEVTGVKLNQADQELEMRVRINMFFKGYRNPSEAVDSAINKIQTFLKELLKPTNRIGQYEDGIKNVVFNDYGLESLNISNDNVVKASVNFTVFVIIETN